jgi:hypothetical protein
MYVCMYVCMYVYIYIYIVTLWTKGIADYMITLGVYQITFPDVNVY